MGNVMRVPDLQSLGCEQKGSIMIKEGKYTILETRGAVAKITINRPEKRNALSRDTIREILAVFEELRTDDSIAVVLTREPVILPIAQGGICPSFPPRAARTVAPTGADNRARTTSLK